MRWLGAAGMLGYECVIEAKCVWEWIKGFFYLTIAGLVIALFSFIIRFTGESRGTDEAIMAGLIIAGIGIGGMVVVVLVSLLGYKRDYNPVVNKT
jgi:hypothetical protein